MKSGKWYIRWSIILYRVFLDEAEKKKDYVGPIEPPKSDIRQEAFALPAGFVWDTVDVLDDVQVCVLKGEGEEKGNGMWRLNKYYLRFGYTAWRPLSSP